MNVYRKIGGGILRINGKSVNSGDTFQAYPEQIPKNSEDIIKLVRTVEQTQPEPEVEPEDELNYETLDQSKEPEVIENYTIYDRGYGWFDILDSQGIKVYDTAMREDEAKEELNKLNNGTETT